MSEIFGNDSNLRGCFMVHRMQPGSSRGAQLILPSGALPATTSSYSEPLMCVGFDCQLREKVLFNKCFAGRTYTYAFGHDPAASTIGVHLLGFLAGIGYGVSATRTASFSSPSSVVDTVLKAYANNRVSAQKQWAMLMLGNSTPLRGFVVGMSSSTNDQQRSLQSFTIHLACPSV